jgi:hypothetical protein
MSTATTTDDRKSPAAPNKLPLYGLPELQNATFSYGVKSQADRYVKAVRLISDHVGRTMGKDMYLLLTEREEASFPEPPQTSGKPTTFEVERYKILYQQSVTNLQDYNDKKAKLLRLLLIQCHPSLRSRLEMQPEFKKLQQDDDVLGLLDKIKELVYSTEGGQYEYWTLQTTISNMMSVQQGTNETPQNYHRRFTEHVTAAETIWGSFYPTKLAKPLATDGSDDALKEQQTKARNQMLSCMFLAGTDRNRYKQVIDDLNNDHLLGQSNYPPDSAAMLHFIVNRRGIGTTSRTHDDLQDGKHTSFAQKGTRFNQKERARCSNCGKHGHHSDDCTAPSDDSTRTYTLQEIKALLETANANAAPSTQACAWNGFMIQK